MSKEKLIDRVQNGNFSYDENVLIIMGFCKGRLSGAGCEGCPAKTEFSENGKLLKCRVAGFSATRNNLDIRPIYSVTDCADWIYATSENMLESGWKIQKGQNFVSVNTLFGAKNAKLITVNPIGRVFRKK